MSQRWSETRRDTRRKGTYAILHGRAYPRVVKGGNLTDVVTAPARDIEQLWRDPAIVLSDADLDEAQGAQDLPLCFEHKGEDVVGKVQYTSLDDNGALDLIARVPVRDAEGNDIARGLEIVEQVRQGQIRGFSVGYHADVRDEGRVLSKELREISLVKEPFFGGCNLRVAVMASASGSTTDSGESRQFVPFVATMSDSSTAAAAAPAAATSTAVPAATPTPGQSLTPQNPNPSAESLLRQADAMTDELRKAKEAMAQMQARLAQEEEARKSTETKYAQYKAQYADEQKTKADEFVAALKAQLEAEGRSLSDAQAAAYRETFTDPERKNVAANLWAQHQHGVKVAASKKAAEEELRKLKEEQEELKKSLAKASNTMNNGLRSSYADAVSSAHNDDTVDAGVTVTASASSRTRQLNAGEVAVSKAALSELPFLRECNFSGGFTVTASNAATGDPELQALRTSVQAAPGHRLLYDPLTRECNFPNSARNWHPAIMGWLINESGLVHADVSNMTVVGDSKKYPNKELRVDGGLSTTVGLVTVDKE